MTARRAATLRPTESTEPSPSKGRPRSVTDQEILEAARHCAIERGPAVSLDVIATRLGITSPALLKRFGSRQDLMIAALRPSDPPAWVRDLSDGPDDRPLEAQLVSFLGQVFDFFAGEMPCMTALSESGFPIEKIFERDETPAPFRNLWALSAWLKRAQDRGLIEQGAVADDDFESVAAAMLGALHGRVFLSDFMGTSYWRRSRAQYVTDLARVYARALCPSSAARSTNTSTTRRRKVTAIAAKRIAIKLPAPTPSAKRKKS